MRAAPLLAIPCLVGLSACRTAESPPPAAGAEPASPVASSTVAARVETAPSTPPTRPEVARGWWRDAVFYEIFVRSFADSDGDGVGDLRGLTAKLDVLSDGEPKTGDDLGVTGIWLMPIHPSPSYHGYDVTDYQGVHPDYGTLADFDAFLAEAHRRGIKVLIDFVINHASSQHPWFLESKDPKSRRRDWFTWRAAPDPRWKRPWDDGPVWHAEAGAHYYGLFWSGMPDLRLSNPEVEAAMLEAMRFWLRRGVDGFRVDAARHLFESEDGVAVDQPETHAFVRRLRAALVADFPDALLLGEAWAGPEVVRSYFGEGGDEFQLAFSFATASAIKTAAIDGQRVELARTLDALGDAIPDRGFDAPFLSNHDMQRVMRSLKGDAAAMRIAAATLFAMPGTPFIYYGEEIGMQGGTEPRDEDKRTPMRWTASGGFTRAKAAWHDAPEAEGVDVASQRGRVGSLWTLYRDLIALRRSQPALARGGLERRPTEGGGRGALAVVRQLDGSRVLFVANFHREPTGPFTVALEAEAATPLAAEGLEAGAVELGAGTLRIAGLGPQGWAFLRLD
jgi:alpha-amylase